MAEPDVEESNPSIVAHGYRGELAQGLRNAQVVDASSLGWRFHQANAIITLDWAPPCTLSSTRFSKSLLWLRAKIHELLAIAGSVETRCQGRANNASRSTRAHSQHFVRGSHHESSSHSERCLTNLTDEENSKRELLARKFISRRLSARCFLATYCCHHTSALARLSLA